MTEPKTDLTAEEREAAKRLGMSPERYGAMKDVRNIDDYEAARRRLAAKAAGDPQ